jgi:hypothetical protein
MGRLRPPIPPRQPFLPNPRDLISGIVGPRPASQRRLVWGAAARRDREPRAVPVSVIAVANAPPDLGGDLGRDIADPPFLRIEGDDLEPTLVLAGKRACDDGLDLQGDRAGHERYKDAVTR